MAKGLVTLLHKQILEAPGIQVATPGEALDFKKRLEGGL
jgi:hypothetical protein